MRMQRPAAFVTPGLYKAFACDTRDTSGVTFVKRDSVDVPPAPFQL